MTYTTKIGTYKGHPTIGIYDGGDFPVMSFGAAKARAILASVDAIRAFVERDAAHERAIAADDADLASNRSM